MRELPQKRLNKRIMSVWRINAAIGVVITAIILIVIAVVLTKMTSLPTTLVWGIAVGLIILNAVVEIFVIPPIRYSRWRYEVTTTEVDIMRGLIIRSRVIIPLVRVQHVETSKGPIMSQFNLSSVNISTAGASFEIPGLEEDEAEQLRDQVSVLARIAQEDI